MSEINLMQVLHQLVRAAAAQYGKDRLGFPLKKLLGTHLLMLGAALAMFIAGVPVKTIQLIGRWKSNTFMRYTTSRMQVQYLCRGHVATEIMTTNLEMINIGQPNTKRRMWCADSSTRETGEGKEITRA
jgi:hypothetical protein